MSLTSKALDEKFPGKIQLCFANKLVNTLIMIHLIKLDLTFKSVTKIQDLRTNYQVLATINISAIWSLC